MMLSILNQKPILEDDATHWLFDTFAWALKNFDADVFYKETILVTPSNQHFPGRESSVDGIASLVFNKVKEYAGLSHWPLQLVDANTPISQTSPRAMIAGPLRGSHANIATAETSPQKLFVPYNANQIAKPEALIASYAHILAHYLGQMAEELPPGGEEFWPHATELVAVFLGFGLMVANSAYTFKGGCGSCYNPLTERSAFLSQDEATYALAIFCVLKKIPNKEVLPHLKSYLRPVFKKAVKEINNRQDEVDKLISLHTNAQTHRIESKQP